VTLYRKKSEGGGAPCPRPESRALQKGEAKWGDYNT